MKKHIACVEQTQLHESSLLADIRVSLDRVLKSTPDAESTPLRFLEGRLRADLANRVLGVRRSVKSNLLVQLVQHLLRLVLVAIEPPLDHVKIVVRATTTPHDPSSTAHILSAGDETLLQELVAALVQKAANDLARVLHHVTPQL